MAKTLFNIGGEGGAGTFTVTFAATPEVEINGTPVVLAEQQGAISDPTGGATVDTQARTAIVAILTALRTAGYIAT